MDLHPNCLDTTDFPKYTKQFRLFLLLTHTHTRTHCLMYFSLFLSQSHGKIALQHWVCVSSSRLKLNSQLFNCLRLYQLHEMGVRIYYPAAVLSMPFGGIICPLMFLFVTTMTLTKPVWSQLVPCWSICDQNDRPAEVNTRMSSPFSLLIHLWMLRSPVVAGYSGQGLCRPGTFTFIKRSAALTAGTCGRCLWAFHLSHWLFVVSSQSIKIACYC